MDRFTAETLPEDLTRRTSDSRHYRRPDGRLQAIVSRHLNYRSSGTWKRREDFALRVDGGEIVNDSDDVPIRIRGRRVFVPGGWFELEGLYLDDQLLEAPADVEPVVTRDRVTFVDVFPGVDVEYLVTPHRVKETVWIRRNPLLGRFVSGSELTVRFRTSGRQKFRSVWARDAQRRVEVAERWKGGRYELAIASVDLRRAVFPLEIDPTSSPVAASDAFVDSNGNLTDGAGLNVGHYYYDDGKGTVTEYNYRSYLRFNLSAIATTITAATFFAWHESGPSGDTLRQAATEMDPETGTPSFIYAYAAGTSIGTLPSEWGPISLACTAYANTHKGGFCDFGIIGNEVTGYDTTGSYSSSEHATAGQRPYLSITYDAPAGGAPTAVVASATADAPASHVPHYDTINAAVASSSGDAPASHSVTASVTAASASASADAPASHVPHQDTINATVASASGDAAAPTIVDVIAAAVADATADAPSAVSASTSMGLDLAIAPVSDGYVKYGGQSDWATARNATAGTNVAAGASLYANAQSGTAYGLYRTFFTVDVSAATGLITAARLNLVRTSPSYVAHQVVLVAGLQGDPLALEDFDAFGTTELSDRVDTPTTQYGVLILELNAAGLAYLNANKAGARFCLRCSEDLDNTGWAGVSTLEYFASIENANEAYRPIFDVTSTGTQDTSAAAVVADATADAPGSIAIAAAVSGAGAAATADALGASIAAVVTGSVASATADAPAPSVAASISGSVASATAYAPAGLVAHQDSVNASVADASADAPAGHVVHYDTIAAPVASATADAPSSHVAHQDVVNAAVASATADAPAGISAANLTGSSAVVADAAGDARPAAITQAVTASVADASAQAGAAGVNAAVQAALAAAAGDSPSGVSIVATSVVQAAVADATAEAPSSITTHQLTSASAVVASAGADAPSSLAIAAAVDAAIADALADALIAGIRQAVPAPIADASGDALEASIAAAVDAVFAEAFGDAPGRVWIKVNAEADYTLRVDASAPGAAAGALGDTTATIVATGEPPTIVVEVT